MNRNMIICYLSFYLSFISMVASSKGIFQIHIRDYKLNSPMLYHICCVDQSNKSCDEPCSIFMEICLSFHQKKPYKFTCSIGEGIIKTEILGQQLLNKTMKLDYSLLVRERWLPNFNILVKIKHRNTKKLKKEELVHQLSSSVENVQPGLSWITKQLSTANDQYQLAVSFRYLCDKYFYGAECDKHCRPSSNANGHYNCSEDGNKICHTGYTGKYCEKFICNEKCLNGVCTGPNICRCTNGWEGETCDKCIAYPNCLHGKCRIDPNTKQKLPGTCECENGWGGMFCNIDLNFCANHPNTCQNGGECQNYGDVASNQQYRCKCKVGYEGFHCEKHVDDCQIRGCLNAGLCKSQINSNRSICHCAQSYYGERCQFNQTSCKEQPCVGSNSKCFSDPVDGFTCQCATGFAGRNCEIDEDECSTKPCSNGGMCIDMPSGFSCVCPVGFSGYRCQVNKDDCRKLSCLNGGRCIDRANRIECQCKTGWSGPTCAINIDECQAQHPTRPLCYNGGKCIDLPGSYKCLCPPQFTGPKCQLTRSNSSISLTTNSPNRSNISEVLIPCPVNPCSNNARCLYKPSDEQNTNPQHQFFCMCPDGYKGKLCKEPDVQNNNKSHLDDNTIRIFIVTIIFISIVAVLSIVIFMYCKTYRSLHLSKHNSSTKSQNLAGCAQIKVLNNKLSKEKVPLSINKLNNQLSRSSAHLNCQHNQNNNNNNFLHSPNLTQNPIMRTYQCTSPNGKAACSNQKLLSSNSSPMTAYYKSQNNNPNIFMKSSSSSLKQSHSQLQSNHFYNDNIKLCYKSSFDSILHEKKQQHNQNRYKSQSSASSNHNSDIEIDMDPNDIIKNPNRKSHTRSSSHNSLLENSLKHNLKPALSQQLLYQSIYPITGPSTSVMPTLLYDCTSTRHTNINNPLHSILHTASSAPPTQYFSTQQLMMLHTAPNQPYSNQFIRFLNTNNHTNNGGFSIPHNMKIDYTLLSNPIFHETTTFLYNNNTTNNNTNSSAQSIDTNSTVIVEDCHK